MLVLLVVFFLLGYTLYAALFAAVGAMVSSEQEAQQAQIPVIMMLVLSILFLQPVLNAPDSGLATTLAYLPFSAPVVMPLRMSAVSVPWWEVTLSLVALASASYLAVYVAARIYRTGILLYGKRPGIREVLRWIRRASA
jgi:ABC-2 type transport system permease protein